VQLAHVVVGGDDVEVLVVSSSLPLLSPLQLVLAWSRSYVVSRCRCRARCRDLFRALADKIEREGDDDAEYSVYCSFLQVRVAAV
jgi:hypothetical protein